MNTQSEVTRRRIFTIPNLLSLFRLCLIPVIVWLYKGEENTWLAGWVIILSGFTDIVDGFVARRFHMVSDLGKILDPFADKLTQLTVLICLVSRFRWMLLPIVCMVVKELIVSITGFLAIHKSGTVPSADWHGKVATVLLYAMMILHIFWVDITRDVSAVSIALSTAMIGVSFVLYSTANIKTLKGVKPEVHNE